MSDESNNHPSPPQLPPDEPPRSKGSLAAGVMLAFAIIILGALVLRPLLGGIFRYSYPSSWFLDPVPLLVAIVTAIILIVKGRSKTGIGIFLGLALIVAFILLFIAACFGLLSYFRTR